MKTLLSLLFICLSSFVYSQFDKISYEIYYQDDGTVPGYPEGYTTYRLYVELMSPGDQLFSLPAASGCSPIQFSCNNDFWNSDLGGVSGQSISPALIDIYPSLEYDSYLTIGASNSQEGDVAFVELPGLTTGYVSSFGSGIGTDFSMQDGVWFGLPPSPNIYPIGPENRVLIAQITTSNPLSWELAVQVRNAVPQFFTRTYLPGDFPSCNQPNIIIDTDSDLIGNATIPGCTDALALNYNSLAQTDNGTCVYSNADNSACAISSNLAVNGGPQMFSSFGGDNSSAAGSCWSDETTNNGVWIDFNSPGESAVLSIVDAQGILSIAVYDSCGGNEIACADGLHNYDFVQLDGLQPNADYYILIDSSSPGAQTLELMSGSAGCILPEASNYDENALFSDGSCVYEGCTDQTACNYSIYAVSDDGSCQYPDGCTHYAAFNYDPAATCDDGSCVYEGCLDPEYATYNPNATIDNGNCEYLLQVYVFQDFEENGILDFGTDVLLGNIGIINIQTGDITFSDPSEQAMLTFPPGTYDFDATLPSSDWFITTDLSNVEIQGNEGILYIGLSTLTEQSTFVYPNETWTGNSDFFCEELLILPLTFQNFGNVDATVTLEIITDPTLEYEFGSTADLTIVSPGHFLFSNVSLTPGASIYNYIGLSAAEFSNGDLIDIDFSVLIEDLNSNELINESWTEVAEVYCDGFFPNLTSNLLGYGEEAYILPEDDLLYTIQVENTTGATAENIEVTTVLSSNVDWMTFLPLGSTSQATISISQVEETITYLFEGINLEDGDELQLFYKVSPSSGLLGGEQIYNIAEASFDGGAPVPTNSTLHTIFNCDWIDVASDLTFTVCDGEEIQIELSTEFIESFAWTLDDEVVGDDSNSISLTPGSGDHTVVVLTSNPLCERSATIPVVVNPLPDIDFTVDGAQLSAADGSSWQWYLDGEAIEGANMQTYTATVNGNYSVAVESEFGCAAVSNSVLVIVVGIEEGQIESFVTYPNPTFNELNVQFSSDNSNREIELVDVNGRSVIGRTLAVGKITTLDCSALSKGHYFLKVLENGVLQNSSSVLVK